MTTRSEYLREHGNWVTSAAKIRITNEKTSAEVHLGDTVTSFRGESAVLKSATRFRSRELGKTGKVAVEWTNYPGSRSEYYDTVFDLSVEMV